MKLALIGVAIFLFICVFYAVRETTHELKDNYEKPDTTITVHNGKPDTLIVKKQAPTWLK